MATTMFICLLLGAFGVLFLVWCLSCKPERFPCWSMAPVSEDQELGQLPQQKSNASTPTNDHSIDSPSMTGQSQNDPSTPNEAPEMTPFQLKVLFYLSRISESLAPENLASTKNSSNLK